MDDPELAAATTTWLEKIPTRRLKPETQVKLKKPSFCRDAITNLLLLRLICRGQLTPEIETALDDMLITLKRLATINRPEIPFKDFVSPGGENDHIQAEPEDKPLVPGLWAEEFQKKLADPKAALAVAMLGNLGNISLEEQASIIRTGVGLGLREISDDRQAIGDLIEAIGGEDADWIFLMASANLAVRQREFELGKELRAAAEEIKKKVRASQNI